MVGLVDFAVADRIRPSLSIVGEFTRAFRKRLNDRRFWIVQAMVIGVTVSHALAELFDLLPGDELGAIYFLPASLYFFPVLYASLNFGLEGAVPTALWSAALAIPNVILWHHGLQRVGEAFQLSIIVMLAGLVATRVDRETAARHRAEEQELALRDSELKYRSLFDSAGQAIMVFDAGGVISEANAAAAALLSWPLDHLRGASLVEVLGEIGAEVVMAASRDLSRRAGDFALSSGDSEIWLEPVCTTLPGTSNQLSLVLFWDVTVRRGLQSFAREIVRAQEEERQRIARELHDVSLQSIVLLCRRLDAVEETAADELPPSVAAALEDARRIAEGIGGELRRFSRDLRPSILDDLGLVPALRYLVTELIGRSETGGRFILSGTPWRLPANAEVALFRIAQEGLRNVERHSQASRVTVRLTYEPDEVLLTIIDNGRGFQLPPQTASLVGGGRLGLLGMQERARLVGGECQVSSKPGQGTRVVVRLPASA